MGDYINLRLDNKAEGSYAIKNFFHSEKGPDTQTLPEVVKEWNEQNPNNQIPSQYAGDTFVNLNKAEKAELFQYLRMGYRIEST